MSKKSNLTIVDIYPIGKTKADKTKNVIMELTEASKLIYQIYLRPSNFEQYENNARIIGRIKGIIDICLDELKNNFII